MASFTLKLGSLDLSSYTRVHPQDGWDPYGGGDWANPQFSDAPFAEGRPLLNIDAGNREMVWPLFLRGTGGSHAWTPNDITGCELWLAADKITGLTDGTAVSSWTDSSGNSRHAVQATGGLQPVYKTAIVNGLPVVRFDAVDDLLNAPLTNSDATRTVFVVVKGQATNFLQAWALNPTGGAAASILSQAAGTWSYAHNQAGGIPTIAGSSVTSFSTITTRYNSTASCDLYVNGAAAQNIDPSDAYQDGTKANFQVGGGLGGDIAEIIVFNSALSGTDLDTVRNYLGAKYNLGYGSTPAAVTDSTSAKDNLHTLVQQINREIANPTSSPLRVEWKDQGASNSTFFDVTYARWDPHFNYRLGEKGYADGAVRVWCQPPYGHTATERVIATAAGTAPGLIASLIGVPSPLIGDVAPQLRVTVNTSGEGVGPAGRGVLVSAHTVPGYQSFISAASFAGPHPSAALVGASGAPGSQALWSQPPLDSSPIARLGLSATAYAGRKRLFAAIQTRRYTPQAIWAADTYRQPVGPTAVTYRPDGFQLLDMGVINVATSTPTTEISLYGGGAAQTPIDAAFGKPPLSGAGASSVYGIAGVYVLPEGNTQAAIDPIVRPLTRSWFSATGGATQLVTRLIGDYGEAWDDNSAGVYYGAGPSGLYFMPSTAIIKSNARSVRDFRTRMIWHPVTQTAMPANARAGAGLYGADTQNDFIIANLDFPATALIQLSVKTGITGNIASMIIASAAGFPTATGLNGLVIDMWRQDNAVTLNARWANATGISYIPSAGMSATTVPVASTAVSDARIRHAGVPWMFAVNPAGVSFLQFDELRSTPQPSEAYRMTSVSGDTALRSPITGSGPNTQLQGALRGPLPAITASSVGITAVDWQLDSGPMNDPLGTEVRVRERFTYAR